MEKTKELKPYKCSDCEHEFSQPEDAFDAERDLYPGCPVCGSNEFFELTGREKYLPSFGADLSDSSFCFPIL